MSTLTFSIILSLVGPVLGMLGCRLPPGKWSETLDRWTLGLMGIAIITSAWPRSGSNLTAWYGIATLLTIGTAAYFAMQSKRKVDSDLVVATAIGTFLIHALVDGAALFSFGDTAVFGPAIAADRFALGLFTWRLLHNRIGALLTVGVATLIAIATWGGYAGATVVMGLLGADSIKLPFQLALTGALTYLVLDHRHHCHGTHPRDKEPEHAASSPCLATADDHHHH